MDDDSEMIFGVSERMINCAVTTQKTYSSQVASPVADLKVPSAQTEQVALTPSGPVYPSEQTLQSAAALEPASAVLPAGQLHERERERERGERETSE